jgi:pyruvate ferredoxin oxidoreductase alpha subunit
MVGPEAFAEVKALMHVKQMQALDVIGEIAGEFEQAFGRSSGGLVKQYRSADAETVVVALGSVLGTIEDAVDELRDQGVSVGAVGITCFRPWPLAELRAALGHASRVVVLEKAFAVGLGGIVGQNVRLALEGLPARVNDVVGGLGGRPIIRASVLRLLGDVREDRLEPGALTFLDLDWRLVQRELERPFGPHAENILRDLAAGPR